MRQKPGSKRAWLLASNYGEPRWLALSWAWLAYLLLQRGDDERARSIYAEHESLLRDAM